MQREMQCGTGEQETELVRESGEEEYVERKVICGLVAWLYRFTVVGAWDSKRK